MHRGLNPEGCKTRFEKSFTNYIPSKACQTEREYKWTKGLPLILAVSRTDSLLCADLCYAQMPRVLPSFQNVVSLIRVGVAHRTLGNPLQLRQQAASHQCHAILLVSKEW
jgi:hypothetical protein